MSAQLLPCPFCGEAGELIEHGVARGGLFVLCRGNCASGPTRESEAEAVAAWNARVDDARVRYLRARVDQLEDAITATLAGPPSPAAVEAACAAQPPRATARPEPTSEYEHRWMRARLAAAYAVDFPNRTALDLDAIEARVNRATLGPWVAHYPSYVVGSPPYKVCQLSDPWIDNTNRAADAAFIAAARQDIPALIAEVRRLRAEVMK